MDIINDLFEFMSGPEIIGIIRTISSVICTGFSLIIICENRYKSLSITLTGKTL